MAAGAVRVRGLGGPDGVLVVGRGGRSVAVNALHLPEEGWLDLCFPGSGELEVSWDGTRGIVLVDDGVQERSFPDMSGELARVARRYPDPFATKLAEWRGE